MGLDVGNIGLDGIEKIEQNKKIDGTISFGKEIVDDLVMGGHNIDKFLEKFPNLKYTKIKETLEDKFENVAEVHMAEAATTISDKNKSILATYGAGPCIIVGGYSEGKAALAHLSAMNKINSKHNDPFKENYNQNKSSLTQLLFFIGNNKGKDFKIIISGGSFTDEQKEEIISWINAIITKSSIGKNKYEILISDSSSLAIDSRTGKFYKYDSIKNPNSRKISKFSAINPKIKITHYEYRKD